jgi:hypothetical protein
LPKELKDVQPLDFVFPTAQAQFNVMEFGCMLIAATKLFRMINQE